jgi:hypothetical protein
LAEIAVIENSAQLQVESRSKEIAGIAGFLRVAVDRAAMVTQVWCMEVRARHLQGGGIFAKVEFVSYCVEYLYNPVTIRFELYLAI